MGLIMEERNEISRKSNEERLEHGKKKKSRIIRLIIKIVIWCAIIIVMTILTLYLSSKIGEFDSIADMMRFIRAQFN